MSSDLIEFPEKISPRREALTSLKLVTDSSTPTSHFDMANAVRFLAMDIGNQANLRNLRMPLGMTDIATVLFARFLKFDPGDPNWSDRDRFLVPAGLGSSLVCALRYLAGYEGMTIEKLKAFGQQQWRAPYHLDHSHCADAEMISARSEQGIGFAVGLALAERLMNHRFGNHLVDHFTYVMCGDDWLMEGLSHEAISLAGYLKLGRLIVFYDEGSVEVDRFRSSSGCDDQIARFAAFGWSVRRIDGRDPKAITKAIEQERKTDRPSLVAYRAETGCVALIRPGSEQTNVAGLASQEASASRIDLHRPHQPFEIPDAVLTSWRAVGARGRASHETSLTNAKQRETAARYRFQELLDGKIPESCKETIRTMRARFAVERPSIGTDDVSQQVVDGLSTIFSNMIGGSTDRMHLRESRMRTAVKPGAFDGNSVDFGIREHAMAATMNGMALHGGLIIYGSTLLAFSDYSRPAIRMAASMGLRVIYLMNQDSIGSEDQVADYLASLRTIPKLLVFHPADALETIEAWDCALRSDEQPSLLCLSSKSVASFRSIVTDTNMVARGAFITVSPEVSRDVTLIASGFEVAIAVEAAQLLAKDDIYAAVVSIPCFEIFAKQSSDYQLSVLGRAPRIAMEAVARGQRLHWNDDLGKPIRLDEYRASLPENAVDRKFEFAAEMLANQAKRLIVRLKAK